MSHATANTLKTASQSVMIPVLNQLLADSAATYFHIKQAHWNVKGPTFIALHEMFDAAATAVYNMIDLLAERAVQLGGEADGTLAAIAKRTAVKAYPSAKKITAETHLIAVSDVLALLSSATRKGIAAADKADDAVTADMLTNMTAALDKHLWFVESHLA